MYFLGEHIRMNILTSKQVKTQISQGETLHGRPLGITAKYVTPPLKRLNNAEKVEFKHALREKRFSLLRVAAKLLPGERVASCMHHGHGGGVGVVHNADGAAHYSGLVTCGSIWHCPVCARKINLERRHELHEALKAASEHGLSVYLVTFTLQHSQRDALKELIEALTDSLRRVKGGAPWGRFVARYGVVGHVSALEITSGAHGWHPHKHYLLFTDRELTDNEKEAARVWLSDRFIRFLDKHHGRYASDLYAVDIRGGDEASDYVTKWGLDSELTGSELKNGHGYTPFQLLMLYSEGDLTAGERFIEYARAMKGKRQLIWSNGLRDLLNMRSEKSDSEIANEDEQGDIMIVLTPNQWRHIVEHRLRAALLNVADSGDVKRLLSWLTSQGVPEAVDVDHERTKRALDRLRAARA